jgi:hypothetical protein
VSEEGFLSRWSRRKRAAESGLPEAGPAPPATAAPASPAEPPPPPAPAEPAFDLASLPSIESLTAESDFAAFLRKEVPEALRRAALRKAWALDPAIRDFVGPADYAWDFNAPDGVPGFALDLKGDIAKMLAQAMGLDAPEEPAPGAPDPAAPGGDGPPAGPPVAAIAPPEPGAAPARLAEVAVDPPEPPQADLPPPRRHGSALPS